MTWADHVKAEVAKFISENPELQDDPELRADSVEGQTDFNKVMDWLLDRFAYEAMLRDGAEKRAKEFKDRAASFDANAERFRAMMFSLMRAADQSSVRLAGATISVRQGSSKVVVDNVDDLGQGYVRIEKHPDKIAIKKSIENGEAVPGAHIEEGGLSLSIRTK